MRVGMTVHKIRRHLRQRIDEEEKTLEYLREVVGDENDCVIETQKAVIRTLVDAYNDTFMITDKRNKRWKCKICGNEFIGVIKPRYVRNTIPYDHECDFEAL